LHLDLYDWNQRDWVTVIPDLKQSFTQTVSSPARFLLPAGQVVHVRIAGPSESVETPDMLYDGVRWLDVAYYGDGVKP
jgi:hypothetical protein